MYGNWPPLQNQTWLNRKIALDLQRDFGILYDYLVNRDVVWDAREERPGNKWQMINLKTEDFRANLPELPLSDMLVAWDTAHGYAHIPHAYPLLPRDVPQTRSAPKKSLFSGLKKNKPDTTKDAKTHLQLSIVFSDATNIDRLDSAYSGNSLIDLFEQFELGADLKNTTPREARLGRWVLLHGILQVLSTLSVDVQSLKHTEGVRYFLCADVRRCPDWVTNGQTELLEASQQRSWCWQRSWDPTPIKGEAIELEASSAAPALVSEELDSTTLDGTTLMNNEIRRLGEKIDNMGVSSRANGRAAAAQRDLDARRENDKVMQAEFAAQKADQTYRITESDYVSRPVIPNRSPLRSPGGSLVSPISPSPMQSRGRDGVPGSAREFPLDAQDFPARSSSMAQEGNFRYEEERRGWR